jgi:hypothetical protein
MMRGAQRGRYGVEYYPELRSIDMLPCHAIFGTHMADEEEGPSEDLRSHPGPPIHIWNRTSVTFATLCDLTHTDACVTPDSVTSVDRELLCPECLRIFNKG